MNLSQMVLCAQLLYFQYLKTDMVYEDPDLIFLFVFQS